MSPIYHVVAIETLLRSRYPYSATVLPFFTVKIYHQYQDPSAFPFKPRYYPLYYLDLLGATITSSVVSAFSFCRQVLTPQTIYHRSCRQFYPAVAANEIPVGNRPRSPYHANVGCLTALLPTNLQMYCQELDCHSFES